MTFAVVTDSAACLPAPVAAGHGIRVVDLHALPGPDGQPATTARPSVQELAEAYRDALRGVDEVLALHVTAALSGTIDNARLAAEAVAGEGRVEVVDLGVSGGALGLSVLAAAEADDMRRGAARARESASRSHLFFLVEDLSYLRRGGRIDRRSAALGGALGIRPILKADADGVGVVETVRGRGRARRRLIELAVAEAGGPAPGSGAVGAGRPSRRGRRRAMEPVRLAVHYGEDPAAGRALENDLAEAMAEAGTQVVAIMRSPVDAASRVHLGPGALGVVVAPALPAVSG